MGHYLQIWFVHARGGGGDVLWRASRLHVCWGSWRPGSPSAGELPVQRRPPDRGRWSPPSGELVAWCGLAVTPAALRWVGVRRAQRDLALAPATCGWWACGECRWGRRVDKAAVEIREEIREK
jgi:hypothetical protein